MDKSLKVGEDEWRGREKGEQNFEREKCDKDAFLGLLGLPKLPQIAVRQRHACWVR